MNTHRCTSYQYIVVTSKVKEMQANVMKKCLCIKSTFLIIVLLEAGVQGTANSMGENKRHEYFTSCKATSEVSAGISAGMDLL